MDETRFLNRIHRSLDEVYGDGVISVLDVRKWCTDFQNGWTDIHAGGDECTGRPSTSRTNINAALVQEMILENRRVTIRDLQF